MALLLDRDFKITIQHAQITKERTGESQGNDAWSKWKCQWGDRNPKKKPKRSSRT